jgi:hypothetical protein
MPAPGPEHSKPIHKATRPAKTHVKFRVVITPGRIDKVHSLVSAQEIVEQHSAAICF